MSIYRNPICSLVFGVLSEILRVLFILHCSTAELCTYVINSRLYPIVFSARCVGLLWYQLSKYVRNVGLMQRN